MMYCLITLYEVENGRVKSVLDSSMYVLVGRRPDRAQWLQVVTLTLTLATLARATKIADEVGNLFALFLIRSIEANQQEANAQSALQ